MKAQVQFSKLAAKGFQKAPPHCQAKLLAWKDLVEADGLEAARTLETYRDHALHGDRAGQRAIRLNYQWRAIYVEDQQGSIKLVTLEEITPHDY